MPLSLARPIRVPADEHHADEGDRERERRQHAQPPPSIARRVAQDARQPQKDAVGNERVEEVNEADEQDATVQSVFRCDPW
jgi:hypothetical protein